MLEWKKVVEMAALMAENSAACSESTTVAHWAARLAARKVVTMVENLAA